MNVLLLPIIPYYWAKKGENMEKLYTVRDAARSLGLAEKTVRLYVQQGKIDHVKLAGSSRKYARVRFKKEHIDRFIDDSTVSATEAVSR